MADTVNCGICRSEKIRALAHIIVLTDEEKETIRAGGREPPDECIYCRPCWKTLSNPASAPMLMKGFFEATLRSLGVVDAEKAATKFYAALVQRSSTPKS